MSKDQANILWIGLFLVVLYIFTDANIRGLIFGHGAAKPSTTTTSFDLASPSASSGNGTVLTSVMNGRSVTTSSVTAAQLAKTA